MPRDATLSEGSRHSECQEDIGEESAQGSLSIPLPRDARGGESAYATENDCISFKGMLKNEPNSSRYNGVYVCHTSTYSSIPGLHDVISTNDDRISSQLSRSADQQSTHN